MIRQVRVIEGNEIEDNRFSKETPMLWGNILTNFYDTHIWLKSPHQREDNIWSPKKQELWIERLCSPVAPIGCLFVYRLESSEFPMFLNDGLQRVSTTYKLREDPETYEQTKESVGRILNSREISVQIRMYKEHQDAMLDFQYANMGTTMTAREFFYGEMVYTEKFRAIWEPLLFDFDKYIELEAARIVGGRKRSRSDEHKWLRHNYVLLYRYLTENASYGRLDISDIREVEKLRKVKSIERLLSTFLEDNLDRVEDVHKKIESLSRMITKETALMEDIWKDIPKKEGLGLSPSTYKWLLELSIWKRFNNIKQEKWEHFVRELLKAGGGGSRIGGKRTDPLLSMGNLSLLKKVCRVIKSDIIDIDNPKRDSPPSNARDGWERSHVKPFSKDGEGETIMEPAGRNRARGAKPIEQKELF